MKPRPLTRPRTIRPYVPYHLRGEPIRPTPLIPLEQDQDAIGLIARRIRRVMAKVEIAIIVAFVGYVGTHLYFGLARQGLLPW